MKKSILQLQKDIENCYKRIDKIQAKCKHGVVEKKYWHDEGAPKNERYGTDFRCLECDKHWSEFGSK